MDKILISLCHADVVKFINSHNNNNNSVEKHVDLQMLNVHLYFESCQQGYLTLLFISRLLNPLPLECHTSHFVLNGWQTKNFTKKPH